MRDGALSCPVLGFDTFVAMCVLLEGMSIQICIWVYAYSAPYVKCLL